tara:strand:+ start:727 stop:1053 length:327 start_codon:yes stop_codon:yes gene_type:complete
MKNIKTILNILFLFLLQTNVNALFAIDRKEHLNQIVISCFNFKQSDVCEEALIRLEGIQSNEASLGNYSCQTRLLGLQADLIMTMQNKVKRSSFQRKLKEIKQFCRNF